MNEQDLRAVIREAVQKALAARASASWVESGTDEAPAAAPALVHPSQGLYVTLVNVGDACVIEPGVPCNHCGYCRTHGH